MGTSSPMTRGEILAEKVGLLAQRLVEAEGPDLEVIANKAAFEGRGRSGGVVWDRHERRLRTLTELLTERIRLEKDERDYPLASEGEGTWLYDLRIATNEIIDQQATRL
jgi:hypothetical protein